MIKHSLQILLLLIAINQISFGQNRKYFSAEITTWYQNKPGAISISFDDASYSQYEYAFPALEKYNLKATFSLIGEWTHDKPTFSAEPGIFEIKKMGWREIVELSKAGHEIAAHGFVHHRYGKWISTEVLKMQMKKIKNLIENKLQQTIYTLHYPYSFTSDSIILAAKKAGFLFGRTEGIEKYNSFNPKNKYLLVSQAILNDTTPNIEEFDSWLNEINGNWLIIMYHHIFTKDSREMKIMKNHNVSNTYSLYPSTFEKQMNSIAYSNYWTAPISCIGKYIIERENTKVKLKKFCRTVRIKTYTNLNKNIYNQSLTIKVKLPWEKVSVKGSEKDGVFEVKNNELLIDILPGKSVKIRKKK
jgi:peptidoglycan/xylan/chitin deacetylase (PgdA/CDA1 family)